MSTSLQSQTFAAPPPRATGPEVRSITDTIGAEIIGLDVDNLGASDIRMIRQAVLDHCVVRLRGYEFDDDKQVELGRYFGALVKSSVSYSKKFNWSEKYPEITVISNIAENGETVGVLANLELNWHTDLAFDEVPPAFSLLRALEVPETGGNTGFANMYRAYDGLPAQFKERVEGLRIKHQRSHDAQGKPRHGYEDLAPDDVTVLPGPIHPIVRTHPDSGRKALYLGRRFGGYVMGLPVEESEALLNDLWHYGTLPDNTWHQQWQPGDMMIWDNRSTMHRRDDFPADQRRRMHRIVTLGSKPY